ncbi:MAG TPA: glycosyltransferase family 2 protein, partial [Myxococcota bacterium]|nr:glycosyltransferase family 2 protein [Myxococcota bacterium]
MQAPETASSPPWLAPLRKLPGLCPALGMLASTAFLIGRGEASLADIVRGAGPWTLIMMGVLVTQCLYVLFQSAMWVKYEPVAPDDAPWPTLTVIIPAYNEGPMVERSIRSVVQADYPLDKLEVMVVDDGSRDDTYFHMLHLRRDHPGAVTLHRFKGNKGKRAALVQGFRAARGEIVLTLDSDSEVEPQTLKAMVMPFKREACVGAVAGRVRVLNRTTLLGNMLDVQFTIAFDFVRAGQSSIRTVMCCPGALSAFRRDVILPHLDGWSRQTFLGRSVSHGEDQALTNIVLRSGYDTVYQSNAVVLTLVPQTYRQLTRMLTRWDRSYIVEGFSFGRFMLTGYRSTNRWIPAIAFTLDALRVVTLQVGIVTLPFLFL